MKCFRCNDWPCTCKDGCTIIHGDCREIIPELTIVDLVFTSPPYGKQRDYNLSGGVGNWTALVPVALSKIKMGTTMLINLGLFIENGELSLYWDELIKYMRARGHKLQGWYVWHQGHGLPGKWAGRLAPSHEWIFHWGELHEVQKTIECISHKPGKKNGSALITNKKGDKEIGIFMTQPFRIPDTVFKCERSNTSQKSKESGKHPAIFPVQLPKHYIAAFTTEGQIVLDPFMGSGTTLRAAKDLGRKCIGIEIEEKYCETAAERLRQEMLF